MKTLFAISIVALVALLWASISIAQHIRRARLRRRSLLESNTQIAGTLANSDADEDDAEQHTPVPPTPVPFANTAERADWAYFNKNSGDLSDPYQSPRNKTTTQSPRP